MVSVSVKEKGRQVCWLPQWWILRFLWWLLLQIQEKVMVKGMQFPLHPLAFLQIVSLD